jgi:hypothetical protein
MSTLFQIVPKISKFDRSIIKSIDRISLDRIRGFPVSIDRISHDQFFFDWWFDRSIIKSIDRFALADSSLGRSNFELWKW